MSQYTINIGALPNDGTGDPLRTAFNETNLNFDQVFAAGPVLSNIQIANNKILTTNTNGNLVLAPNGTGVVQSNVSIVPNLANLRNLGSSTQRWSSLYVQYANISGNLDLSGTFSVGDLAVTGNLTVTGNTIQVGNIVTETLTIQLANAASTANAANGSGITVGANDNIATMLYSSTSNTWTTNIGVSSIGNITAPYFIGNGSQLTGLPASYGNANVVTLLAGFGSNTVSTTGNISGGYLFGNGSQLTGLPAGYANTNAVAYGESGWAGNIIPSGNAVYSLGNATNQWNDLYVSNATIFMNNVPLSLSAGNVLTVNGNAVLTNGSNTAVSTAGNITAGNIGITGGSLTWANASIVQTSSSDLSITGDGQVTVRSLDGTYQWTFESNGNLTAPGNVSASGNVTGAYIKGNGSELTNLPAPVVTQDITSNGAMSIMTYDGNIKYVSYATIEPSSGNITGGNISTTGNVIAGNINSPTLNNSGNISVVASSNTWTFDTAGNLVLPQGGIVYETNIPDGGLNGKTIALVPSGGTNADQQLLIYPTVNDANHLHLTSGNLYNTELFLGDDNLYVKLANTGNVVVNSNDNAGNTAQWIFNTAGTLTLPGGSRLRPLGANLDIFAGTGSYVQLVNSDESSSMGIAGSGGYVTTAGGTWNFGSTGNLTAPGNISAVGNITSGNLTVGSGTITG